MTVNTVVLLPGLDGTGTLFGDSNGNTLTKTDSTGTANYTWDFENHLGSVALPGGGGGAAERGTIGRR